MVVGDKIAGMRIADHLGDAVAMNYHLFEITFEDLSVAETEPMACRWSDGVKFQTICHSLPGELPAEVYNAFHRTMPLHL